MKTALAGFSLFLLLGAWGFAQTSATQTQTQSSTKAASVSAAGAPDSGQKSTAATSGKSEDKSSSEHHSHVRLAGIGVSAGYAHVSPGFYPYGYPFYPYGFYSAAMLWDPFWGYFPPYYPDGYFGPSNGKGELKLSGAPKNASVYVDGGYAGTVDHLKSFWLDPGVYDLEVSSVDGHRFEQRVYVLTGKSLKIVARLDQPRQGGKP